MQPQDFITKWRAVELKERSASQSHFNDLCAVLGTQDPISADPKGEWFTFEEGCLEDGRRRRLGGRLEAGLLCLGVQGQAREPRDRAEAAQALSRRTRESAPSDRLRHGENRNSYLLDQHDSGDPHFHLRRPNRRPSSSVAEEGVFTDRGRSVQAGSQARRSHRRRCERVCHVGAKPARTRPSCGQGRPFREPNGFLHVRGGRGAVAKRYVQEDAASKPTRPG